MADQSSSLLCRRNQSMVPVLLNRFSYSTTLSLQASLRWTHLHSPPDDIHLVLPPYQSGFPLQSTENKIIQVFRNGNPLETIPLENVVEQARWDEERMMSQKKYQDQDRMVLIIVKNPLLALRYQLPNGQVHRVQFNFGCQEGFNSLFETLRALSLPIKTHIDHAGPYTPTKYPQSTATLGTSSQRSQSQMHPNPFEPAHQITLGTGLVQRATSSHTALIPPISSAPELVERPFTAPVATSQMLPPRRQLPFPKPKSNSIPSSIVEQAGLADTEPSKKVPTRARARPKPNTPRKLRASAKGKVMLSAAGANSRSQEDTVCTQRALEPAGSRCPPTSVKSLHGMTNGPSQPLELDSVKLSQTNQATTQRSRSLVHPNPPPVPHLGDVDTQMTEATSSVRGSSSNSAARTLSTPFSGLSSPLKTAPLINDLSPEELMSRMSEWVRHHQTISRSAEKSSLTDYASKPDEERQALIDNLICNCLEDDNFLKLAEDVCGSLTRTGLTLQ